MNLPLNNLGFAAPSVLIFVVYVWTIFWKGIALWRATKSSQKYWFIAMLFVNTVGILEIVFLFKFAKDKLTLKEIKSWVVK